MPGIGLRDEYDGSPMVTAVTWSTALPTTRRAPWLWGWLVKFRGTYYWCKTAEIRDHVQKRCEFSALYGEPLDLSWR